LSTAIRARDARSRWVFHSQLGLMGGPSHREHGYSYTRSTDRGQGPPEYLSSVPLGHFCVLDGTPASRVRASSPRIAVGFGHTSALDPAAHDPESFSASRLAIVAFRR